MNATIIKLTILLVTAPLWAPILRDILVDLWKSATADEDEPAEADVVGSGFS